PTSTWSAERRTSSSGAPTASWNSPPATWTGSRRHHAPELHLGQARSHCHRGRRTSRSRVGRQARVDPDGRGGRLGLRPHSGLHWGEAVTLEECLPALDDPLPFGELVVVVSSVAVLIGVLELVEGGVLGIQELPVPLQESFVDHPVRL